MSLQATVDQAFAAHRKGRLDEAERLYAAALAHLPDHADLLFNHGSVLLLLGRVAEAADRLERAVAARPSDAAAWNSRGAALAQLGDTALALDCFDRSLTLRPGDGATLLNRARTLVGLGRVEQALDDLDRAVAAAPRSAEAWYDRGGGLRASGRHEEALRSFDTAVAIDRNNVSAQVGRGLALLDLQRFHDALAAFDRALALSPGQPEALNNRGLALQYVGQREPARAAFRQAIAGDGAMAAAYLNYSGAVGFTAADPLLPMMEAARRNSSLSLADQVRLDFALAKAHGDLGDYPRSFRHMARGNRLWRDRLDYDEPRELAHFDDIATAFDHSRIASLRALGASRKSSGLVFVVGMPRSGTTLIEQILASHPQAVGAGELSALHDAVRGAAADRGLASHPAAFAAADAVALTRIADRYLDAVAALKGSATHLVDKMPSNFFNLGLIVAALPGARIVHCTRDPLDTCFSRFAKLFLDRSPYCYDLGELGRYHRRYEMLMAHWHATLPAGAVLEVRYEDVVGDLEGAARSLLEHCDLPWDPRCLDFHRTERGVKTPSALQVRQPLYQSSVGRARSYAAFLGPLKEALGIG